MDQLDSIVDMLDKKITADRVESYEGDEIFVPHKCAHCGNNVICSVLPTFIGLSKIGILIGVEQCPFNTTNLNQNLINQKEKD